jgi:hypothetical protein
LRRKSSPPCVMPVFSLVSKNPRALMIFAEQSRGGRQADPQNGRVCPAHEGVWFQVPRKGCCLGTRVGPDSVQRWGNLNFDVRDSETYKIALDLLAPDRRVLSHTAYFHPCHPRPRLEGFSDQWTMSEGCGCDGRVNKDRCTGSPACLCGVLPTMKSPFDPEIDANAVSRYPVAAPI